MDFQTELAQHDAFVFDLDNVLYPEKDFYLQVYYLFGQFIEYSEQLDGAAVLKYMQETYLAEGHEEIFEKTAARFGIHEKYKLNFDLLLRNIRLPLKLLLFEPVLRFLKAIVAAGKPIFLLVSGVPEAQLNKIKQTDWEGLEQYLTVYFIKELDNGVGDQGLTYLVEKHELQDKNLLLVGLKQTAFLDKTEWCLKYLPPDKLF